MKLSTSLVALVTLFAAVCLSACTADTKPDDGNEQTSDLTDAEKAKAKGQASSTETGGTVTKTTDLTTGSSTCTTCGPLPDPWTPKQGPLPDPWKSTSGGGGTGTGTSSTDTGSSGH